jgi:hypothetical protein
MMLGIMHAFSGATLYAFRPAVVGSRRSLYAYGVKCSSPYIEGEHPESYKEFDIIGYPDCPWRVPNLFSPIIAKGQEIVVGMPAMTKRFQESNAAHTAVTVYQCSNNSSMFTDQEGMRSLVSVTVKKPPGQPNSSQRDLDVSFKVDGVELLIEVVPAGTKEKLDAVVQFAAQ